MGRTNLVLRASDIVSPLAALAVLRPVDWLSSREFFRGAKSIVMQIYFVMLTFLLFSDQISGEQKSLRGGANCLRGGAPTGG